MYDFSYQCLYIESPELPLCPSVFTVANSYAIKSIDRLSQACANRINYTINECYWMKGKG